MTNPNKTHLLTVVDRSGSMQSCKTDMIGALNQYFEDQAAVDGECVVTYYQFDTVVEKVFEDKPVSEAKAQLQPRNMTALLDAIGRAVTELGDKLAGLDEDERPGLVQVVVVSDGYENASREWTIDRVRDLIRQQEDEWNWKFVFLGANMDAVATGSVYGFSAGSSLTYSTSDTYAATASLSGYTTRSRLATASAGSAEDVEFTDEERESQDV